MEPLDEYFDHQTYTRSEEYQYVKAYHNWLQDKGMIRDVDHIAERTDGKSLPHPMGGTLRFDHTEGLPHSVGVPSCPTINAKDAAPGPTVEQVKSAYQDTFHGAVVFHSPATQIQNLLRTLYPSILETK